MPQRKCDVCGKVKDVFGAKVCENGHFICYSCLNDRGVLEAARKLCPIDKKPVH